MLHFKRGCLVLCFNLYFITGMLSRCVSGNSANASKPSTTILKKLIRNFGANTFKCENLDHHQQQSHLEQQLHLFNHHINSRNTDTGCLHTTFDHHKRHAEPNYKKCMKKQHSIRDDDETYVFFILPGLDMSGTDCPTPQPTCATMVQQTMLKTKAPKKTTTTTTTPAISTTTNTPTSKMTTTKPTLTCAKHFTLVGDQCYYVSNFRTTWHAAVKACNDAGSELAHPINLEQHTLLTTHLNAINKDIAPSWWLGGSDEAEEGKWVWRHDNSTIGYNNWLINQPDNNNNEDCLELLIYNGQYKWNDADCRLELKVVCHIPPTNTAIPTTAITPPTTTTAIAVMTTATPTTPKPTLYCGKNYTLVGGQCYHVPPFNATWHNAFKYCKDTGGELPHPMNLEQHTLLTTYLNANNKDIAPSWWLGGTDEAEEGKWVWRKDNSTIGYDNWFINQPSNNSKEDCLELLVWNGQYKWNDADCRLNLKFVCVNLPTTTTTLPTTPTTTPTTPATTTKISTTTITTPALTTTATTTSTTTATTTTTPTTTTTTTTATTTRPTTTTTTPTTTATTTTPAPRCPVEYIRGGDLCYRFSNENQSWHDAQKSCQSRGSLLAHPITRSQINALKTSLHDIDKGQSQWWIGVTKIDQNWVWSHNNITFNETDADWIPKEPNNAAGNEFCATAYGSHNYQWDDRPCDEKRKFICQVPLIRN